MFTALAAKQLTAEQSTFAEQTNFLCGEIAKYFGAPLPVDPHSRFIVNINETVDYSVYALDDNKLFPERDATIVRIIHTAMSEPLAETMSEYAPKLQKYVDNELAGKEFSFDPADFYRKLISALTIKFKQQISKPGLFDLFQPTDVVFDATIKYLTLAPLTAELLAELPCGTAFKIQQWWENQLSQAQLNRTVSL